LPIAFCTAVNDIRFLSAVACSRALLFASPDGVSAAGDVLGSRVAGGLVVLPVPFVAALTPATAAPTKRVPTRNSLRVLFPLVPPAALSSSVPLSASAALTASLPRAAPSVTAESRLPALLRRAFSTSASTIFEDSLCMPPTASFAVLAAPPIFLATSAPVVPDISPGWGYVFIQQCA
jgi:hypothetical protein